MAVPTFDLLSNRKLAYIYSDEYLATCDMMPRVPSRASMTHELISAFDLLQHMHIERPRIASIEELLQFHSTDYIDCLKRLNMEEDDEKYDEEGEQFGLGYDCPAFTGVLDYSRAVVGASLHAAKCLVSGDYQVAINWPGGWHHAKRDEAAGFCYLNDAVAAILKLREKFERVLYVDLDLHHGDGVEDAFCATSKVMTVSFHKVAPGFFPGSGQVTDVGMSKGKYYTVNVPLRDGLADENFIQIFHRVISEVQVRFAPQAIVCQCGVDGLARDPMTSWNLTSRGYARAVLTLRSWHLPLLLLGGGGYNLPNTARCWAYITAMFLGQTLPNHIPENEYFLDYGPDYDLDISPGNQRDLNDRGYVDKIIKTITENLAHLPST